MKEVAGGRRQIASGLLKSALLVSVGTLAWRGMVFILLATISARLPIATSSALVQTISTVASYATVVHFASSTFLVRLLTRDEVCPGDVRRALRYSGAFAVVGAAIVTALCLSNEQIVRLLFGGSLWLAALVVYLATVGISVADFVAASLYGIGRYRVAMASQITMGVVYGLAVLTLWAAPDLGVAASIAATGLTGPIAAGWALATVKLPAPGIVAKSKDFAVRFLNISAPLVISAFMVNPLTLTVVSQISSFTDHQLLAFLIGLNWMGLVMVIPGQLSSASISFFMRSSEQSQGFLASAAYVINFLAVIVACTVIVLFADLFASAYGEAHLAIAVAISICIWSALPYAFTQIVSNQFAARGSMWGLLLANGAFGLVFGSCLLLQGHVVFDISSLGWALFIAHVMRFAVARLMLSRSSRGQQ